MRNSKCLTTQSRGPPHGHGIQINSIRRPCVGPLSWLLDGIRAFLFGLLKNYINFDLTKGNTAIIFAFTPISVSSFYQNLDLNHQDPGYVSYHSNAPPLAQQIRLAQLQTYLI